MRAVLSIQTMKGLAQGLSPKDVDLLYTIVVTIFLWIGSMLIDWNLESGRKIDFSLILCVLSARMRTIELPGSF
jgi:hypothetical protein